MGRCANRVQNASFVLDGQTYQLAANNGKHALHGGVKGFDKHEWAAERITHPEGDAVTLTRTSPDGEEVYSLYSTHRSPQHTATALHRTRGQSATDSTGNNVKSSTSL